jgi:PAS domain S-box-containing protein
MPISNGIEVSNKIRAFSNIPIILYTNQSSEKITEESFHVGINDYLKKEIDPNHFRILEKKIINATNKYRIEKIFNEIVRSIDDSIIIVDKTYNIIYHNEVFIDLVEKVDLIGKSILEVIEKESKKQVKSFLNNNNETKIQAVILDSNDISHFVEISKIELRYTSNGYYIIKNKDNTDIIVQNSIKTHSEERFLALAKISPDAIMISSIYGYVTYINQAYTKLTGYTRDEIIGRHILQLQVMKGRDVKPYWGLIKQIITGKSDSAKTEFTYTRKDGTSGIGDFFIGTVKVGKKRELIGIVRDITERRMKEEEYQNIFKTSPEGIIHLDVEGNIKNINESAIKILNVDPQQYIGTSIFEAEDDFNESEIKFTSVYDRVIKNKMVEPFEIKIKTDNNRKWLQVNANLIKVLDETLGIQLSLRDITEQKKYEIEREHYTLNLEKMVEERTNEILDNEKMVTLAKVSSMLAHDLKGPLQIISNSIHLIKYKPEEQDVYLEYIKNAVNQANELINEMRRKGKESPIQRESIDIKGIIEESLIQIKVSENIQFETIIKSDKKIHVDRLKMIRVINNLIKNAIEAMPNGGKIIMIIEEEMGNLVIKITDTGLGIPEEKINNLFRPFQSTKASGMGLGLTYCKNTVEAHGGSISVKSEQGKGTTFTINIPFDMENNNINHMSIKDTLIE